MGSLFVSHSHVASASVTLIVVMLALSSFAFTSSATLAARNSSASVPAARPGSSGGPKIVFGSVRNGDNHDVFLMDLDGSNQIRITNNPAYDDQPKWSPDGSRIAFISDRDGNFEIYVMNLR